MGVTLVYKNGLGEVVMTGDSSGALRICDIEGLGPVVYEYNAAVFAGYDGQETVSKRAVSRHITLSLELNSLALAAEIKEIFYIIQESGTLYVFSDGARKRINCNQTHITDIKRVLKGEISTFAVQFVCDNPFFEDENDTVVSLYERRKCLATPFVLPSAFGEIVIGGGVEVTGTRNAEPMISVHYPSALESEEGLIITNLSTGTAIQLDFAPVAEDTVVIDVKNRRITSMQSGNIINCLSMDTFLGDFVFVPGLNVLDVSVGDVSSGFFVECKYNNSYNEAVIT